jgi:hypothetical protein
MDMTGLLGYTYVATYRCLFEIATVPGPGYVCIYNPLKDEGNSTNLDDSILGESIGDFNGGSAMEVRSLLLIIVVVVVVVIIVVVVVVVVWVHVI